ncbi:hypothetical protein EYZ11_006589 [Aspergillus tanneri]|uniref:Coronin n=1 Tax=Aspergillus tanneri TaxID=1220188 RepID=A0A4S3JFF6_9EURO|nr:hypothetical protein EYZ11_006589 [Aspergillus tanneri]
MSGRFVRSSKYREAAYLLSPTKIVARNLTGTRTRLRAVHKKVSRNAWDTNLVKVNPRYLSVNWEAGGGGAFAVIPLEERGKLPEKIPLFRGHTAVVLDTDWNPFNDDLIASGSDDGRVLLWRVPENFTLRPDVDPDDIQDIAPVGKLSGHPKQAPPMPLFFVLLLHLSENILATASGDFTVKVWDIEAGAPKFTLNLGDIVQSQSWSANGSLLVTTSRDKKLRLWDVRQERPAQETQGHSGAKNSRSVWLGERDRIATTGFSKMSDRQLALWDIRAPREPINGFKTLDSISGVCMPFWDDGTQCLYLAGRGDGNIRYFELENDKFEYLAEYKSSDPQRGVAFMPKRGVNAHENEVTRAFKTVNDSYIEPISFIVPRRAESFQDDIYPPTIGLTPAMGPADWIAGKEAIPPKISMASLYEGEGLKEVTGVQDKPTATMSAPEPSPAPKPVDSSVKKASEPTREPTPVAKPAPSMKEQGASMAAMVSKFADKEDEESEPAEESSFDEIPKPVEQLSRSTDSLSKEEPKTQPSPPKVATPVAERASPANTPAATTPTVPAGPTLTSTAAVAADAMQREVSSIKELIAEQTKTIALQAEQMQTLTAEIESLKAKLG